jgi:hypothetical protein
LTVAKVDELMALCDRLEASLAALRAIMRQLSVSATDLEV